MDAHEPPQIVFEAPAPCEDARGAQEILARALAPSSAPRAGWSVLVRVTRQRDELTATGEITDDAGAPVAHRAISKQTRECSAVVRALGVWASLVLDEEVQRASEPSTPAPAPPEPADPQANAWPEPAAPPPNSPEQALFLKNPESRRDIEIGAGASYSYGALGDRGGAIMGAHLFGVFESVGGWFWRPSVAYGRSLREIETGVSASWAMARFDLCGRMPGNYLDRRGLQMDVCGGFETGAVVLDSGRVFPLFAPGGSLAMRGELGGSLAAEVRGMVGVNAIRETLLTTNDTSYQPLLVFVRLDMGLSWRFR